MRSLTSILLITLLISSAAITGCSSDGSKNKAENKSTEKTEPVKPQTKLSFENEGIKTVYEDYINLKNVLVKSDPKEAQSVASALQTSLTTAGNSKGADLAGKIASATELSAQRAEFNALSAEVESTIRSGKIAEGKIYKQYCPMANDGNGGYWLSGESEIRNPYYGDDMLECGEVKEEIQ
ncbi:MAG TPA: DUF3347 domain-containing protein [Sphingobacteriaceae bacterium]